MSDYDARQLGERTPGLLELESVCRLGQDLRAYDTPALALATGIQKYCRALKAYLEGTYNSYLGDLKRIARES